MVFDSGMMSPSRLTRDLPGQDYLELPAYRFSSLMQSSLGATYFCLYDWLVEGATNQSNLRRVGEVSWGIFATSYDIGQVMGIPIGVEPEGLYTDIDNLNSICVSSTGSREEEVASGFTCGAIGSCLESGIYDLCFEVPAVSTTRILSEAANQGGSFNVLTNETPESIIDGLNLSSSEKASIQDLLAGGNLIGLPTTASSLEDWQGRGWMSFDLENGSSGFFISGQMAGGSISSLDDLAQLGDNDPPSSFLAALTTEASLEELTSNEMLLGTGYSTAQIEKIGVGYLSYIENISGLNDVIIAATTPQEAIGIAMTTLAYVAIEIFFLAFGIIFMAACAPYILHPVGALGAAVALVLLGSIIGFLLGFYAVTTWFLDGITRLWFGEEE
jgi:hypothetical protein